MPSRSQDEPPVLSGAQLQAAYDTACDADDPVAAEGYLRRYLQLKPEIQWAWFDVGLLSKRRRDWARCAEDNRRALALAAEGEGEPAAWNLGIAATALGNWGEAAQAWTAYGIDVPALTRSTSPLVLGLGSVPVRLNPEPRHLGETTPQVDGLAMPSVEVVWCQRLCPARAVIRNVPTPDTGHRFGDIVLHDGEPVGERISNGHTYSVFNELQLIERSPLPTLEVLVEAENERAYEDLAASFHRADLGAEDWGTMVMLCRQCSEGSPGGHDHPERRHNDRTRTFALGAHQKQAATLLAAWAAVVPGRTYSEPQRRL